MSENSNGPAAHLRVRPRENYLRSDLPSGRDAKIKEIVQALNRESDCDSLVAAIRGLPGTVLTVFCQRAATMAVRSSDSKWIVAGLRAAAVASAVDDLHDVIVALALLWYSSDLLGDPTETVFVKVSREAGNYGMTLDQFAKRVPSERTLEAMMYSTRGQASTFSFKSNW